LIASGSLDRDGAALPSTQTAGLDGELRTGEGVGFIPETLGGLAITWRAEHMQHGVADLLWSEL
jgi:hypothetical protein